MTDEKIIECCVAGFFMSGTKYAKYNPYGVPSNLLGLPFWAGNIGQDAYSQTINTNIDYMSVHL